MKNRNWDELERLYLEETKNETVFGEAPKLYEFISKINKGEYLNMLIPERKQEVGK